MKKLTLLFLIYFIYSCNFFGPIDEDKLKQTNSIEVVENDLKGEWKIDKFSYDLIHKKGTYAKDSLLLILDKDKKFIFKNLPDFFSPFNLNSKKFSNSDESGNWKIVKINNNYEIQFIFKKSNLFKSIFISNFKLVKFKNNNSLLYFIGDPDSGERFLFIKK